MNSFFGKIASSLVRGYQLFISPLTPPSCRFYPVCSEYSRVTFLRHGLVKGIWLTAWRILRCNPFNPGGWDPVPPKRGETDDDESFYVHEHDEIRSELNPGKSNE